MKSIASGSGSTAEITPSSSSGHYVIKRNGQREPVRLDEITERLNGLAQEGKLTGCDPMLVAQETVRGLFPGVRTSELDNLAAETAAYKSTIHPHYEDLAARIVVSNLHKLTEPSFSKTMEAAYANRHPITGTSNPLLSDSVMDFVRRHAERLDGMIRHERDYDFTYFGIKTLMRGYLFKRSTFTGKRSHEGMPVHHHSSSHSHPPPRPPTAPLLKKKKADGHHQSPTASSESSSKTKKEEDEPPVNPECILERPQHMLLRVAVGIHHHRAEAVAWPRIEETYDLMSRQYFIHASPTLFNSGTPRPSLSSCYLLTMKDDSIEGIYDTLKDCALVSKAAGGVGLNIHKIRSDQAHIRGTNGRSNGIVPMVRVYNETSRYVDQGGGKRPGAFAMYLEPWHPDIFSFIELRSNTGAEVRRARNLFLGLWLPDEFYRRVRDDREWSYFDPDECPGLSDVWGEEFDALYDAYEKQGKARFVTKARELWFHILEYQIETGTPYMLAKDRANARSNHQNSGLPHDCHHSPSGRACIRCSNLCTEIIEYSCPEEVAVCNLCSTAVVRCAVPLEQLQRDRQAMRAQQTSSDTRWYQGCFNLDCVDQVYHDDLRHEDLAFDHYQLFRVIRVMTINLDTVIDITLYPLEEARRSNLRLRPQGQGIQGLANLFARLRLPFESDEAMSLQRDIFETIYFAALWTSCELAGQLGPYPAFEGSPASQGKLHMDLCAADTGCPQPEALKTTGRWNWELLRQLIAQRGLRNSLLVAPMPTASTSQILGSNECFEPFTNNLYSRRVLAGEFTVINRSLIMDLQSLGLWTAELRDEIIAARGSIQHLEIIPPAIRELYKTVWEMSQLRLIDMAAARAHFIDQSQSLNLYLAEPTYAKLTTLHMRAWECGLKTCMYYLRSQPAAHNQQFTVIPNAPGFGNESESDSDDDDDDDNDSGSDTSDNEAATQVSPSKKIRFSSSAPKRNDNDNSMGSVCTREAGCLSCSG